MNPYVSALVLSTYFLAIYFVIFRILILAVNSEDFRKSIRKKTPKLKRCPSITVVIPSYNEEKGIGGTIDSVLGLKYPKDKIHVIVVNDGSKDKTAKVVEEKIKKYPGRNMVLINQKNQGKAKSMNNALKRINTEFFACLDADSIVDRDTLTKMMGVFENDDERLAIVTPAMKVKNPKGMLQKLQRVEYIAAILINKTMCYLNCIHVAPGPFSVYRTRIIKKLGGFDVKNLTEDQEIAYRAQAHHYRIKLCFNGYTYTKAPATLRSLYGQRNRWIKGSLQNQVKYRKLFFNRKYGDFGMLQVPNNFFNLFLGFAAVFLFFYYLIIPLISKLRDLYLVGFDLMPFLKGIFKYSFEIAFVNLSLLLLFIFLFALTFTIFYLSHKTTNERISKYGMAYLVVYFLVYYLMLSFIAVIAAIELLVGRKQKW